MPLGPSKFAATDVGAPGQVSVSVGAIQGEHIWPNLVTRACARRLTTSQPVSRPVVAQIGLGTHVPDMKTRRNWTVRQGRLGGTEIQRDQARRKAFAAYVASAIRYMNSRGSETPSRINACIHKTSQGEVS